MTGRTVTATKTAFINTRVAAGLKRDAEKVLRHVGVNTSDAVTMFLRQVVIRQGLPFDVRVPNKETRQAITDLRAGKGKVYTGGTKDIFDALEKAR
ncbi:MAG: type II toxin-antitoxin system RelB/DinJ family antitoxin [Patescibacteria group bacterium]